MRLRFSALGPSSLGFILCGKIWHWLKVMQNATVTLPVFVHAFVENLQRDQVKKFTTTLAPFTAACSGRCILHHHYRWASEGSDFELIAKFV